MCLNEFILPKKKTQNNGIIYECFRFFGFSEFLRVLYLFYSAVWLLTLQYNYAVANFKLMEKSYT